MPHVILSGLKSKACMIFGKDARLYECAELVGIEYVQAESVFAMVVLSEMASHDLYRTSEFHSHKFEGDLLCEVEDECGFGVTSFSMRFRMARAAIIEHNGKRCARLSLDNISPCKWTYADGSHSYGVEPRRDRKEGSWSIL